jgi:Arc/MetJ-type ribon-helix-helix transcriptional regulator
MSWSDVHREAVHDWLDERELERERPPTRQELEDESALRLSVAPDHRQDHDRRAGRDETS